MIVFFEYVHELESYLRGPRASEDILIALDPAVRARGKNLGLELKSTLNYFDNEAHRRSLKKSAELVSWLEAQFQFKDAEGASQAYRDLLIRLIKNIADHCLWPIEVLEAACQKHPSQGIAAFKNSFQISRFHYIDLQETYFVCFAGRYAAAKGIPFHRFSSENSSWILGWAKDLINFFFKACFEKWGILTGSFQLKKSLKFAEAGPLLFASNSYKMDGVARTLIEKSKDNPAILLCDWENPVLKSTPFKHAVRMGFWDGAAEESRESSQELKRALSALADAIDREERLFSHRGVPFGWLLSKKLRGGIGSKMMSLHKRAAAFRLLLNRLKPSAVFSNGDRMDDPLMGEICQKDGIPSVLISHGSHTLPLDESGRLEWSIHGRHLVSGPYPYVALQSPLAEEYTRTFPPGGKTIRTGPLVWGSRVDREHGQVLRRSFFKGETIDRVVVHASSPRVPRVPRFHIYEMLDEYIESIQHVVQAVEKLDGVHLIVRFRPTIYLSLETLRALVPASKRVVWSVSGSFADILSFTDLLVSFSSTTIEEALQNKIPVLLYGGNGRYLHVRAEPIKAGMPFRPSAAYHAPGLSDLNYGLPIILGEHRAHIKEELFSSYRYSAEACAPLSSVFQPSRRTGG